MITVFPTWTAYMGIDVAKTKLDVVLRLGERAIHQVFANTADGFEQRVRKHIQDLHADFKVTEGEVKAHLKAHPHLNAIWRRLQTIAGIGWLTATRLLAHLGEIGSFDKVGSLVSLAGLAVKEH